MMNVIIDEGLVDQDYVEKYTLGFEELKARAPPTSRRSGSPRSPACRPTTSASSRANTPPPSPRRSAQGVALERSRGGGQAIRAITCLPALVGAWRHVGGGTVEMPIWEFPLKLRPHLPARLDQARHARVNELDLGAALTGELALDPPIKSLFVYNSNPVSQAPAQAKIVAGPACARTCSRW